VGSAAGGQQLDHHAPLAKALQNTLKSTQGGI
jgi:hypothetical protein